MPFFLGLFTVLYPILRAISGVVALVIIYDVLMNRMLPLYQMAETHLTTALQGAGSGSSQFAPILTFFDISRAFTVLLSAIVVSLLWKVLVMAAKSMAARIAPGL